MFYEVKLSAAELGILAGLIGKPLDMIACDTFAAEIHAAETTVLVSPEEVATPDIEHPRADVERPRVTTDFKEGVGESLRLFAEELGAIRAINVFSILVSFSPVRICPPTELIPGVLLPESQGYGWIYYHPSERELALRQLGDQQALIDLDVAFELVTEESASFCLYTRGYFVHACRDGLPDEEWVRFAAYSRCSLPAIVNRTSQWQ